MLIELIRRLLPTALRNQPWYDWDPSGSISRNTTGVMTHGGSYVILRWCPLRPATNSVTVTWPVCFVKMHQRSQFIGRKTTALWCVAFYHSRRFISLFLLWKKHCHSKCWQTSLCVLICSCLRSVAVLVRCQSCAKRGSKTKPRAIRQRVNSRSFRSPEEEIPLWR